MDKTMLQELLTVQDEAIKSGEEGVWLAYSDSDEYKELLEHINQNKSKYIGCGFDHPTFNDNGTIEKRLKWIKVLFRKSESLIALLKSKLDPSYVYEMPADAVLHQDCKRRVFESRYIKGVVVKDYITTLDVYANDYLEALATRADLIDKTGL